MIRFSGNFRIRKLLERVGERRERRLARLPNT
jgi:hypothetical protein